MAAMKVETDIISIAASPGARAVIMYIETFKSEDWQTVTKDGSFYLQVNGHTKYTAEDNVLMGNYGMMLVDSPFIDVTKETHDSSHKLFKEAFTEGFPWEVLEVLSGGEQVQQYIKAIQKLGRNGTIWAVMFDLHWRNIASPPKVSFTWRHWATWSGPYREQKPTGENIEMFGSCVSEVTSDLKIKNIQIFFDPTPMMFKLTGAKCPFSS